VAAAGTFSGLAPVTSSAVLFGLPPRMPIVGVSSLDWPARLVHARASFSISARTWISTRAVNNDKGENLIGILGEAPFGNDGASKCVDSVSSPNGRMIQ
jgi:hypothetical protein